MALMRSLWTGLSVAALALAWTCGAAEAKKGGAPARPDSSEPWKVEAEHGPSKLVRFTTDEATWLHLDVSPDGRQIVFSLLGDLYLLPIEGGSARRITSGTGYDVQPRFSPDGQQIAFASDRGGLENLWVAAADGTGARQVSSEKDSTVSAPAWSPDGQYLLGRKRLTDRSSLGTVELWLFHLRGGSGLQLTKKDEQPDAADPVFSRDGRFVYFSARDAATTATSTRASGRSSASTAAPARSCRSAASSAARPRPRSRPTAGPWPSCAGCGPSRAWS